MSTISGVHESSLSLLFFGTLSIEISLVVWDWNGTLVDDGFLFVRLMNRLLLSRKLKSNQQTPREIEINQLGPRRDQFRQVFRCKGEIGGFIKVQGNGHCVDVVDEGLVYRKSRTRVDDFIPRIAIDLLGESDGRFSSGKKAMNMGPRPVARAVWAG